MKQFVVSYRIIFAGVILTCVQSSWAEKGTGSYSINNTLLEDLKNCTLTRRPQKRCHLYQHPRNKPLGNVWSNINTNRLLEELKNCTMKFRPQGRRCLGYHSISPNNTKIKNEQRKSPRGRHYLGRSWFTLLKNERLENVWSDNQENYIFFGSQFPNSSVFFRLGGCLDRMENCSCVSRTINQPGSIEQGTACPSEDLPGRIEEGTASPSEELPGRIEEGTASPSEELMIQFCTYLAEQIDVGDENDLQNVASLLETTIQNFKKQRNTMLADEDEFEIRETAHFTTTAFEDFAVRFAQEQLNDANPQSSVTDRVDVKVRRVFSHNKEEFNLRDTEGGNSITIPVENFVNNDSVVLGVMYKDLHELFMTNRTKPNTTKKSRELNTIIMSAAIYPTTEALKKSIILVFKNIKPAGNRSKCVHWNYSEDNSEGWSEQGCNTTPINSSQTMCVCNHLTHFAVLMDYGDDDGGGHDNNSSLLTILTYVGVALSLLGAVITIICYLLLTDKHAPLSQIRVSLVASLAAGQITFLAGIDATDNKGACVTAAALMQYFFMAAFCWMLVEGIYLYLFVVKVYNVSHKMTVYHGMSWGIPAIVVAITLSFAAGKEGVESYVGDKYCWLPVSDGLIWIFVSFVLLIELMNVMILVRVIKEMASIQHVKDQQSGQIKLSIRACAMLIPLLGVTWLVGLLAPLHKAFVYYIFVILNSTQGFLIFVLHCAKNTEIRERFMRRIRRLGPVDEISTSRAKKTSQANQSTVNEVDPSNIFELQENM